ncbi:MAG: hypothetical protein LBT58_03550 [Endomicrobium sp.]|jgi:hypothetical protein|nr:hypothetical protein [Endomicrobium sp.]
MKKVISLLVVLGLLFSPIQFGFVQIANALEIWTVLDIIVLGGGVVGGAYLCFCAASTTTKPYSQLMESIREGERKKNMLKNQQTDICREICDIHEAENNLEAAPPPVLGPDGNPP